MPKLLKKLLSTSTMSFGRRKQQKEIDLIATQPSTSPASPTGPNPSYCVRDIETELDILADRVMRKLIGKGINANTLGKEQLVDILRSEGTQAGDRTTSREGANAKRYDKTAPAKEAPKGPRAHVYPVSRRAGDDGQTVIHAVVGCIDAVERLQTDGMRGRYSDKVLGHCLILLEAQREELKDAVVYMERGRYPALRTLQQVYDRVLQGLSALESLTPSEAKSELSTLTQLLEQGPDYLIDTFLIELIIHHAETLDSGLASRIRDIHDRVVNQPGDLEVFRKAAQGIVAYACAIPSEELDDEMAREAYRTIGKLVKQLRLRVESGEQAAAVLEVEVPPDTATATSFNKPLSSSSSDDNLQALATSALQSRFGTGPLPTSHTSAPKAKSPSPSSSSLDSISLYEYRNQILTSSALDLVMRQEALAFADSSGQYAGEVSWDDLRKAWIPKNVVKVKEKDLAEGEIPSLNPGDYEIKAKDDFGNKIGWTDRGEVYYEDEDPKFEL